MKTLTFDSIPAWYKLGFDPATLSLQVYITEAFITALPPIPHDSPLMRTAQEKISGDLFSCFSADFNTPHFGFNHSIQRVGLQADTGFVRFNAPLPIVYRPTGKACQECGNTGVHRGNLPCFHCNGSKREMVFLWNEAFALTESLQLLLWLLQIPEEKETHQDMPQWFALNLGTEREAGGSWLGGDLSKDAMLAFSALVRMRQSYRSHATTLMQNALAATWKHMMGQKDHDEYNLRVEIRDTPNLSITCPGDATGVYTENTQEAPERGCHIGCHNMDNPVQALACLAGLAVFGELLEETWREK